jgi:hypothetical protein
MIIEIFVSQGHNAISPPTKPPARVKTMITPHGPHSRDAMGTIVGILWLIVVAGTLGPSN